MEEGLKDAMGRPVVHDGIGRLLAPCQPAAAEVAPRTEADLNQSDMMGLGLLPQHVNQQNILLMQLQLQQHLQPPHQPPPPPNSMFALAVPPQSTTKKAKSSAAGVERAATGVKQGPMGKLRVGRPLGRPTKDDGQQRVWDGRQYRLAKRCPHGKVRKDTCKACGGSGICEHGQIRHSCKQCGGRSLCVHKKTRRRCVECGGVDVCKHKKLKHICRECQKEGTGGLGLCIHAKQKQHCKDCKGLRLCIHNKAQSLCKQCAAAVLCQHKKEWGACGECKKEDRCRHKKRRQNCMQCQELRANPTGMAVKVHELLEFLEREKFPGPSHPYRATIDQTMDDLFTMALAQTPAPGYRIAPIRKSKAQKVGGAAASSADGTASDLPAGALGSLGSHILPIGPQAPAVPPPQIQQPPPPLQQPRYGKLDKALLTHQAADGQGDWWWLPTKCAAVAVAAVNGEVARLHQSRLKGKKFRMSKISSNGSSLPLGEGGAVGGLLHGASAGRGRGGGRGGGRAGGRSSGEEIAVVASNGEFPGNPSHQDLCATAFCHLFLMIFLDSILLVSFFGTFLEGNNTIGTEAFGTNVFCSGARRGVSKIHRP